MFPANAGMNRAYIYVYPVSVRVPRKRGDEPAANLSHGTIARCSPQTRG